MSLGSDLKILYHLMSSKFSGGSHGERLESFYRNQVGAYDDFRRRLLRGREEMIAGLDLPAGARVLDMGGGTGFNIEAIGHRLAGLESVTILDLSPSMLRVAEERIRRNGWTNVSTVQADATQYRPADGQLFDVVTFSYSLTMIPDWFRAIDHAYSLLRPGGQIGVADFYIARKWPDPGLKSHASLTRGFWPLWFSWDNVFLSPDHLPYLRARFAQEKLMESSTAVPYMLGLRVPYYAFVGRKP